MSRHPSKDEEYNLEEEELLALLSANSTIESKASESLEMKESKRREPFIVEECEIIILMSAFKGKFQVSAETLSFRENDVLDVHETKRDLSHEFGQLKGMFLRRFNTKRSAIEFFLLDQTNFFLNFFTHQKAVYVYGKILSAKPPNLNQFFRDFGLKSPAEIMKASGLTEKWVNRDITNFEYLMHLNTIAGRTFNDLGQYPIFPWILADYTSSKLDFNDDKTFRDLSKPIGVVNPKNVELIKNKYDSFLDVTGAIEKFHYGTHYSNSAGILHYLVRLEPFTSLHVELQGGRFDVADRQFYSIEATWNMLMDNPNDVKELIPEFFYLPEFLTNMNFFDLGRLQFSKETIDAVKLPEWAKTPEDFINQHRLALESEFVSNHLNDWIDLIFGYKQKGQAAIDALNVFYYVSYEDAVDLDSIKDESERKAIGR